MDLKQVNFEETPTDTARDSESNLDDIAEQPDTARPKSPVAKIADSNDDTTLLRAPPDSKREIRYRKGEFLAIRNTDDGYFLCQTTRPIIGTELQTRIRWLTQDTNIINLQTTLAKEVSAEGAKEDKERSPRDFIFFLF